MPALINRLLSQVVAERKVNALVNQANATSDPAQRQQFLEIRRSRRRRHHLPAGPGAPSATPAGAEDNASAGGHAGADRFVFFVQQRFDAQLADDASEGSGDARASAKELPSRSGLLVVRVTNLDDRGVCFA